MNSSDNSRFRYIKAGCEVRGSSLGSYLYVSPTRTLLRIIKKGTRTLECLSWVWSGEAEGSFWCSFLPLTQRKKFWTFWYQPLYFSDKYMEESTKNAVCNTGLGRLGPKQHQMASRSTKVSCSCLILSVNFTLSPGMGN